MTLQAGEMTSLGTTDTSVKAKLFRHLLKLQGSLFRTIAIGVGTMGFCSKRERLASTPTFFKVRFIAKEQGGGHWIKNY